MWLGVSRIHTRFSNHVRADVYCRDMMILHVIRTRRRDETIGSWYLMLTRFNTQCRQNQIFHTHVITQYGSTVYTGMAMGGSAL